MRERISSRPVHVALGIALLGGSALVVWLVLVSTQGDRPDRLIAAGDVASCTADADEATARLLDDLSGTVAVLGDAAYPDGSVRDLTECYAPTWGRHLARTRAIPGNRDYGSPGAASFFGYFGSAAGAPTQSYYSFHIGHWQLVVLDTQCDAVGGCGDGSPQVEWLRQVLKASTNECTAALMHVPRFSSGTHGSALWLRPIWQVLYEAGVEIVLSGHDHDYERFAPQDPDGLADPMSGIRQFVVGTGGIGLTPLSEPAPNSEIRDASTHGVLELMLGDAGYDWRFHPVAGAVFTDQGSGTCHDRPPSEGRTIDHQVVNDYRVAISALNSGEPFMQRRADSLIGRSLLAYVKLIDQQPVQEGLLSPAEAAGQKLIPALATG